MFTPRFQTHSGQYRKEILHPDGSQEGTYGWVDPNNVLRLFDYIADNFGYRIVKESLFKVGTSSLFCCTPHHTSAGGPVLPGRRGQHAGRRHRARLRGSASKSCIRIASKGS